MSGNNRQDCQVIERAIRKMFRTTTAACSQQIDTKDFLIAVEFHGKIGNFRLTSAEYTGAGWSDVLCGPINIWLGEMSAAK